MRVDNSLPNPWLEQIDQTKTDATSAAKNANNTRQRESEFPDDRLEVSNATQNDIRSDKVEALQRAIANGTYDVSAEDITDAMLRDWRG